MSWPCAVPNLVSKSTLMMGARRDGGGAGINQTPPSQHLEPSLALLQSLTAYSQQPRQLRHVHCDAPGADLAAITCRRPHVLASASPPRAITSRKARYRAAAPCGPRIRN